MAMKREEELFVWYFCEMGVKGAKAAACSASKSPMVAVIANFIVLDLSWQIMTLSGVGRLLYVSLTSFAETTADSIRTSKKR